MQSRLVLTGLRAGAVVFAVGMVVQATACARDEPEVRAESVDQTIKLHIVIGTDSQIRWEGELVSIEDLDQRFAAAARNNPQAEVHIEPDRLADYAVVAAVMAAAQRNGMENLGVIGGT